MAVCVILDAPSMTQAQYDQVRNEVAPGNRLPQGALSHVAGSTNNGWCVVTTWESREALDRFFRDKLQPALQRAGITSQPRMFEIVNTMQP
jgi:hypothetical protein